MEMTKRKRARAIIIKNGKMVSMYREFDDRNFYVFPGGGMEKNETEEEYRIAMQQDFEKVSNILMEYLGKKTEIVAYPMR